MVSYLLYVDPGSGSYLLQVLIAAILGAGFAIKSWWWRIKYFFSSKRRNANSADENQADIKENSGS